MTWLKERRTIKNDSGKLLYRASRDGWAASNFHSCYDNKGPTVIVIKSGNYIFGGYTDQSWDGKSYIIVPLVNRDWTTLTLTTFTLFKEYLIIQNKKDWSANSIC